MKDPYLALLPFLVLSAMPVFALDFGQETEQRLRQSVRPLFGFGAPPTVSAAAAEEPMRRPGQPASALMVLAGGLKVEYVTRQAANLTDQMALWPDDKHPTHLIACVEMDRKEIAPGKLNPSIQRIGLASGKVETLLRGLSGCDAMRRTSWNSIVIGEERNDGGAYEILDPLRVTEQTVLDRVSGVVSDPARIAKRHALPVMAWEGMMILPSGVLIGGDELRPGTTQADADGGALFKFVPSKPWKGEPVTRLEDSPLAAGKVFTLQVLCQELRDTYGQGCETGAAAWIEIGTGGARQEAYSQGATGYYRPEDLQQDPDYFGPGARFCWTNTGDEHARHYAEVLCAIDREPLQGGGLVRRRAVTVSRFLQGDEDFNSFDNLEFQPGSGNLYVIEDHRNGDVFACLPDGGDRDLHSDGCVRALSLGDGSAEPSGFIFNADGTAAYLSIEHSDDALMPRVDDFGTDDVVKITGFAPVKRR